MPAFFSGGTGAGRRVQALQATAEWIVCYDASRAQPEQPGEDPVATTNFSEA
jgi:hypothetical protein